MKCKHLTGKDQEIHYNDGTEIVKHDEMHELDLSRLSRPEFSRLKAIFLFEKKQDKPVVRQEPIKSEIKEGK